MLRMMFVRIFTFRFCFRVARAEGKICVKTASEERRGLYENDMRVILRNKGRLTGISVKETPPLGKIGYLYILRNSILLESLVRTINIYVRSECIILYMCTLMPF